MRIRYKGTKKQKIEDIIKLSIVSYLASAFMFELVGMGQIGFIMIIMFFVGAFAFMIIILTYCIIKDRFEVVK